MMQTSATVNVSRVIDEGRVSALQIRAILLCSLVAFLDGVDSQSIALGAPLIADVLKIARPELGVVFSTGLLGATIGAFAFGPLGDRFGRKRMLIAATTLFGAFTVLNAYARSYEQLLAIRFLAGLGLGGATPCFIALASEYAPGRRRAAVASLIWAAFPLGVSIGGFSNGWILGRFDWQTMFLVDGVASLAVAVALALWLPESIRFLIATGRHVERIGALVARIRPGTPVAAARYVTDEEEERASGAPLGTPLDTPLGAPLPRHPFAEGRAAATLLLWAPFFTAFGILGITVVWSPILLRDHGIPPSAAGFALGVHGLGALVGMGSAGRLMERFGALPILFPALLAGGLLTGVLGYAAASVPAMALVLALIGLTVGCGASGAIALAALIYPTAIRSTGVGWAMAMGRFGQVLAPLFAGAVMAAGYTGEQLFMAFGIAPILGALAVLAFRRRRVAALQAA